MDISMPTDIKKSPRTTYSSAVGKYLDFCRGVSEPAIMALGRWTSQA